MFRFKFEVEQDYIDGYTTTFSLRGQVSYTSATGGPVKIATVQTIPKDFLFDKSVLDCVVDNMKAELACAIRKNRGVVK